jgi:hypothetical protein
MSGGLPNRTETPILPPGILAHHRNFATTGGVWSMSAPAKPAGLNGLIASPPLPECAHLSPRTPALAQNIVFCSWSLS